LVTYAAEQRTKEIGVRKVLGASVGGIVTMLIKRFCKAWCSSLLLLHFRLHGGQCTNGYKVLLTGIDISWWVFIVAGAAAILIALITCKFPGYKSSSSKSCKEFEEQNEKSKLAMK
jgi:putative ABC transport system permease protein